MVEYNRYPAMDANNNFPPAVREALANSPEYLSSVGRLVEPLVVDAIAKDDTIFNAVATVASDSVDEAVRGLSLVQGRDVDEYEGFYIVDKDGRRSWLEADHTGGPTSNSISRIMGFVTPKITAEVDTKLDAAVKSDKLRTQEFETEALVYGISDKDGRRSWLEINERGTPTDHSLGVLKEVLEIETFDPTLRLYLEVTGESPNRKLWINSQESRKLVSDVGDPSNPELSADGRFIFFDTSSGRSFRPVDLSKPTARVLPKLPIVAFGDSLTAANTYHTVAASMLGTTSINRGWAGWSSGDIAVRQGGLKPIVTVENNEIPASGAALLTSIEPTTGWRNSATLTFEWIGTLDGVPGTLRRTGTTPSTWTFTRTNAGTAKKVSSDGIQFVCTENDMYRDHFQIIFTGRNNVNVAQVSRDEALMIEHMTAYVKRFVVISVLNGTTEPKGTTAYNNVMNVNDAKRKLAPNNYLDIRSRFIAEGMQLAGKTPTAEDAALIASDAPPMSLMADSVHPNADGYRVMATILAEYITTKGWLL